MNFHMKSCQVNGAKAEAELAYSLQAAKVQAKIKEEEMQVKLSLCKNTKIMWKMLKN